MASLGGAAAALFLLGFAPTKGLAVAGLLAFGGFLLMTYPSLHTFVGSTVPASGQTMAFSWVSNIQLALGSCRHARLGRPLGRHRHRLPVRLHGDRDARRLPVLRAPRPGVLRVGRRAAGAAGVTHEGDLARDGAI
ncbi:MAG: hypothetical protein MZU79_06340 [Anaerotruncus sp.]|nr:hypothetical protein [Anaerotruncus sp.]